MLVGDQIRLKQILINLVKSALKFTSHGTIQIISYYDVAKELIQVRVTDSGAGMDQFE